MFKVNNKTTTTTHFSIASIVNFEHVNVSWILTLLIHFSHFTEQVKKALREKCPNTEFFLVRIFSHSD